ncbi:MAG: LytR family transcriptional regulator [Alkalicoccus sp.]|nr:MAG: LytR family transcriptional regulator [Alkalicoccus sp.]
MKKGLFTVGGVLLIVLIAAAAFIAYIYFSVDRTINDDMYVGRDGSPWRDDGLEAGDPMSILLLGIDAEGSEAGRSDTIMLLTLNPDDESMMMVNIPRDTRTEIVGRGTEDKINHAYAFGGSEMTVDSVEAFLDVPVDYFFTINMDGFESLINAVDGVNVDNDLAFSYSGHEFTEGELHLNGEEALAYTRMRSEDPRGDLGRNDRQQAVVGGLIDEAASISSLTRIGDYLDILSEHARSNVTTDDIFMFQRHYTPARNSQETMHIEGTGDTIDGVWYYIVPTEERERISRELQQHLQLR